MREQFEKLPEIAERLKKHEHLFKLSSNEYICECSYVENFLNGAWYAFQEQQKKIDSMLDRVCGKYEDFK